MAIPQEQLTSLFGRATAEGTARFVARHSGDADETFYRPVGEVWLSSIGIGTYLGNWDRETDSGYRESVERAVALGCNVIDTAANYRFQRSERAIGSALSNLCNAGGIGRDELVICTKGGYLPFDGEPPTDVRSYIEETFVRPGIAEFGDFVGGSHCMAPGYLQNQIDQSRRNLNLDCLDVYYLHNPESQLGAVSRDEFAVRLRAAFTLFEQNIAAGKIGAYGVATWNGFRVPANARDYHSLEQMEAIAREVAGEKHGFRFIQLPYNLAMPEALVSANQTVAGQELSTLEAALELGITAIASGTISQGKLARGLPPELKQMLAADGTDAQAGIQFTRSAPGVTTALVGMSRVSHVDENLQLRSVPPLRAAEYAGLFGGND
jgi:aryl-alcohol dehydrogenase-like predicted oxidoreductase